MRRALFALALLATPAFGQAPRAVDDLSAALGIEAWAMLWAQVLCPGGIYTTNIGDPWGNPHPISAPATQPWSPTFYAPNECEAVRASITGGPPLVCIPVGQSCPNAFCLRDPAKTLDQAAGPQDFEACPDTPWDTPIADYFCVGGC